MKRTATILTLALLLAAGAAQAQIFLQEDEMNLRSSTNAESPYIPDPGGLEYDQTNYTPLGSGALLLAALGGAYLMGKKRRKAGLPTPPNLLSEGEARSDAWREAGLRIPPAPLRRGTREATREQSPVGATG